MRKIWVKHEDRTYQVLEWRVGGGSRVEALVLRFLFSTSYHILLHKQTNKQTKVQGSIKLKLWLSSREDRWQQWWQKCQLWDIYDDNTYANDEMFMRLYLHHMWCRVQQFQPGVSVKFCAENCASVKKLQMSVTCLWLRRCWRAEGKGAKSAAALSWETMASLQRWELLFRGEFFRKQ